MKLIYGWSRMLCYTDDSIRRAGQAVRLAPRGVADPRAADQAQNLIPAISDTLIPIVGPENLRFGENIYLMWF